MRKCRIRAMLTYLRMQEGIGGPYVLPDPLINDRFCEVKLIIQSVQALLGVRPRRINGDWEESPLGKLQSTGLSLFAYI